MSHRKVSPASSHHHMSLSVLVCVILVALLAVPASASAYDEKIPLSRYRRGHRSWESPWPPYNREIFSDLEAQGDTLYTNASNTTLVGNPKRIAIIGAGFGGVSIAQSLDPDRWPDIHATVFERESYVGGRARTVMSYDDYLNTGEAVGAGGAEFDLDDKLIREQARKVGVDIHDRRDWDRGLKHVGVWNGEELRLNELSIEQPSKPTITDLVRNHGLSFKFWKLLAQETWDYRSWKYYGEADHLKWQRIADSVAEELDQTPAIEPVQREWEISPTELGMQIQGRGFEVHEGNERFLKRMLRMSGSSLHLNSTVTRIKRHADLTFDVHWKYRNSNGSVSEHVDQFDAVIIAAPFHQSEIEIEPPLRVPPEEVKYKPIHVTNVVSRLPLDPGYFNLTAGEEVPGQIWTSKENTQNKTQSGPLPQFLAIRTRYLGRLEGCIAKTENLYQILSEQVLSDNDIAKLFQKDGEARKSVIFPDQSCFHMTQGWTFGSEPAELRAQYMESYEKFYNEEPYAAMGFEEEGMPSKYDRWREQVGCKDNPHIRWIHRQSWSHGLPIVNHKGSEASIELAPRLFHVNVFEGKDGASLSGSVRSARHLARNFFDEYCNIYIPL